MKMSDVRVGMRLHWTLGGINPDIEVTEITPAGFKYRIPDDIEIAGLGPHWSMPLCRDGHEHFGLNGESFYEPVEQVARVTAASAGVA